MNTLIYFNTKLNLNKKNLGGIESLSLYLKKELTKKKINCVISNKITNNISQRKWDNVISSNDSRIFEKVNSKKKFFGYIINFKQKKLLEKNNYYPLLKIKFILYLIAGIYQKILQEYISSKKN